MIAPLTLLRQEKAVALAEQWNRCVPVGAAVEVRLDGGQPWRTTTRSEAWALGGHTAVVMLTGRAGCYELGRVMAIGRTPGEGGGP